MTALTAPVAHGAKHAAPRASSARRWIPPLLCVAAAVLWLVFVHPIAPQQVGSFGLITSLHPAVLLALVVLSAGFVLELRSERPRGWVLLAACVLAVIGMYGLPSVVEPQARLPVAWLHAGFSDYIDQHGTVIQHFDARFSWPAFLAFSAWLTGLAGAGSATAFLALAPPVFTGLATIGVHAVASSVLRRGRAAWLAAWMFLCVNWVEQDYFSPQGLAFVMYVAALALVLRWLCWPSMTEPAGRFLPWSRSRPSPPADGDAKRRVVAAFTVVLLICALSPEHQVTPFALAAILAVLTVAGRLRQPWLLGIAVLAPLTWLVLGASDYWIGHLQILTGGVGNVSGAVQDNVGARVGGDLGRLAVLGFRFALFGLVMLLAAYGWWRMRGPRGRPVALAAAALVPFGLVVLQSYGGEMLLRTYLYALPLLCTLAGAGLHRLLPEHTTPKRRDWLATTAVTAVLGLAAVLLVAARGGNDGYVAFRSEDVTVVNQAYELAHKGQRIEALTAYVPLHWARVGDVEQGSLELACRPGPAEASCVHHIAPDFLVVNPAQDNYGVTVLGLKPGWTRTVVHDLLSAGVYRQQLRIGDTVLLVLTPRPKTGGHR